MIFLIRLWPAEEGSQPAWRASVEAPGSGERQAFASLEELFAYLRQQAVWALPPGSEEGKQD